jgi:RNA polymerase sigma-70 factor (ECF subfamily)
MISRTAIPGCPLQNTPGSGIVDSVNCTMQAGGNSIITDEQLVAAAREGDKTAFKELVKKYESRVAATVIGMLGDCPEADDVGQETFIHFYRALGRFRGESSVGTYITRIAINLSLNELKRRKRRGSLFARSEPEVIHNVPDERAAIEYKQENAAVYVAIRKLKPEFRSVVVLRLIDGYSTEETAKILKIPAGTVLSRLARAQQKLRKMLAPHAGGVR